MNYTIIQKMNYDGSILLQCDSSTQFFEDHTISFLQPWQYKEWSIRWKNYMQEQRRSIFHIIFWAQSILKGGDNITHINTLIIVLVILIIIIIIRRRRSKGHKFKIHGYSSKWPFNVYLYTISHNVLIIIHIILFQIYILYPIWISLHYLYLFWIFNWWMGLIHYIGFCLN